MGHSSTRAALIYQHSTDERQREIADALGQLTREELKKDKAIGRAPGNGSGTNGHGFTSADLREGVFPGGA
jgi:hypothetical protein